MLDPILHDLLTFNIILHIQNDEKRIHQLQWREAGDGGDGGLSSKLPACKSYFLLRSRLAFGVQSSLTNQLLETMKCAKSEEFHHLSILGLYPGYVMWIQAAMMSQQQHFT